MPSEKSKTRKQFELLQCQQYHKQFEAECWEILGFYKIFNIKSFENIRKFMLSCYFILVTILSKN